MLHMCINLGRKLLYAKINVITSNKKFNTNRDKKDDENFI